MKAQKSCLVIKSSVSSSEHFQLFFLPTLVVFCVYVLDAALMKRE